MSRRAPETVTELTLPVQMKDAQGRVLFHFTTDHGDPVLMVNTPRGKVAIQIGCGGDGRAYLGFANEGGDYDVGLTTDGQGRTEMSLWSGNTCARLTIAAAEEAE